MTLKMPELDAQVLARRDEVVAALRAIVPGEGVITAERAMRPYETDGLTAYRQLPMIVVLPETTEQVSRILKYCHSEGIKVVRRGAAAGRRRAPWHGQIQPHPRDRSRQSRGGGRARRHQSRRHPGCRAGRV